MAKSYNFSSYEAWNFDDYFCLKPPVVLTAAIVFLCRSFVMLAIVMLSSIKGTTGDMGLLLAGGEHPTSLAVTGLPALLVLIALIRRSPRGGRFARWIWKRGRILLGTSAVLEIATGATILYSSNPGETGLLVPALLVLDIYILAYVALSKRVRDTFSDFPPTLASLEMRVTEP